MEILKDKALILRKKNVNENNVSVIMFTKNNGKLNAIVYGSRASNKKEKISLSPFSYIDVELSKKNTDIVLKNYSLEKNYNKIYSNLEKLEIAYYIVDVLNKILEYHFVDSNLYDKIKEIFDFLNDIDNSIFLEEGYIYKFLTRFLRRLMIELGIYEELSFKNNLDFINVLEDYERYINTYFNIKIDYKKIFIGS